MFFRLMMRPLLLKRKSVLDKEDTWSRSKYIDSRYMKKCSRYKDIQNREMFEKERCSIWRDVDRDMFTRQRVVKIERCSS